MECFLVDQIACGNPPVQFVGTKVAFVTEITVFYQLRWRPAGEAVKGGRCRAVV